LQRAGGKAKPPLTGAPHPASCTFAGCAVHRTLFPALGWGYSPPVVWRLISAAALQGFLSLRVNTKCQKKDTIEDTVEISPKRKIP